MEYLDCRFELKSVEDERGIFEGWASAFGNLDLQGDVVLPGAFAATLASNKGKVPILMAHQTARIVGFGLDAEEDDKGLKVRGQFALDADDGRNAYAITKAASAAGSKLGLSIGYGVRKNGAEWDEEQNVRKLKAVDLYEYSIAAVPANLRARVSRVKADWTIRDFEEHLREAGLSKEAAKRFVARGYSALEDRRDAGESEEESAAREFMSRIAREVLTL